MPLSDGKSWWVGDIKLPVRVYPDTSECWVSPCTGLNVPAGTKSLLLVFAASKAGPRFAEIQAFSSFDETPPATLQAKSAWKQFAPATFANPCGPVVDITWTATPGVYTHYVVQRGLDERFRGGVQTVPLPPNSTHFVNDCQQQFRGITENGNGPLAPSTDYYYRVGVRKPDGTLVWGNNTVKVHTASPDQTRLTPATLTAKASIGSTVTLAWPAVPGALGYKLERAENATFSNGRTGLVMVTTPGYTDRTAETGASNFYRVRATYADGDSDWATATITTPELSPPPTTLRAEVNVGTVHLKWDSTHGKLHGYEVYRGTDAAHLTPLMPMNIGSPQLQFGDFTDRNVPAGHWCYAVRGVWFTAAFPSEMKYTEFTPAIEVVVP